MPRMFHRMYSINNDHARTHRNERLEREILSAARCSGLKTPQSSEYNLYFARAAYKSREEM